jgi:hypothetical protein
MHRLIVGQLAEEPEYLLAVDRGRGLPFARTCAGA